MVFNFWLMFGGCLLGVGWLIKVFFAMVNLYHDVHKIFCASVMYILLPEYCRDILLGFI